MAGSDRANFLARFKRYQEHDEVFVFPATHYITISRAIYIRAAGPLAVLPELAVLAVTGVALVALALRTIEARG